MLVLKTASDQSTVLCIYTYVQYVRLITMNDGVIVEPMQPIEINRSTKSDLVQKRKTELGQLEGSEAVCSTS